MTAPDAAQNKALEAANAISAQVGRLWMEAHVDGIRNGMEAVALMTDAMITAWRDDLTADAVIRDIGIGVLQNLRDQIRLYALQIPDPEVPGA